VPADPMRSAGRAGPGQQLGGLPSAQARDRERDDWDPPDRDPQDWDAQGIARLPAQSRPAPPHPGPQPTCTAPGCRRPASSCDLDHVTPYDRGGRTCECNLGPTSKS